MPDKNEEDDFFSINLDLDFFSINLNGNLINNNIIETDNILENDDIFENNDIFENDDIFEDLPESDICFPAGTKISTNIGNIDINKINPNIHTIRNKKILAITKTITKDKYLVCFEENSLYQNVPSHNTIISKNHLIYYKGQMIKAKYFLKNNFKNVKKIKYNGEILYNILLETHDKMIVNNIICETLHPDNVIAQLYRALPNLDKNKQNELIKQTNKWIQHNINYPNKIQHNLILK